jgi:ComF family protein
VYKGELRRAILSLKRKPNEPLAGVFALNLAAMIKREPWTPDLIVPIPLSADRLKLRGYNQAEMLAMPVGRELGIPITARGLSRPHSTRPQMNLHPAQRWENVRRAFQAEKASSSGANVLLIDDIITTGATMQAAAVALKEAGAKEVRALSLARALG